MKLHLLILTVVMALSACADEKTSARYDALQRYRVCVFGILSTWGCTSDGSDCLSERRELAFRDIEYVCSGYREDVVAKPTLIADGEEARR